jgi:uncharacterized protein (TIGR02246 family)
MRIAFVCLAAIATLCGVGLWVPGQSQSKENPSNTSIPPDGDKEAIQETAREFAAAFEKGDARAIAALWTEQAEYESADGTVLRGRNAIEAAFAACFKQRPAARMEIQVESIRFPSRDMAIDEGLTLTRPVNGLPESAFYRAVHIREDGKWRIALSREWGAAENRLADLDWLLGTWHSRENDHALTITFRREKNLPFLVGEFTSTAEGKTVPLGSMRIGLDAATGQFQSWHFDPDGGYGHGVWLRERNHWIVDSHGRRGDGTPTAAVNLLTRMGNEEVGWRSIDRMVGGQPQPESPLIRLKRAEASNRVSTN